MNTSKLKTFEAINSRTVCIFNLRSSSVQMCVTTRSFSLREVGLFTVLVVLKRMKTLGHKHERKIIIALLDIGLLIILGAAIATTPKFEMLTSLHSTGKELSKCNLHHLKPHTYSVEYQRVSSSHPSPAIVYKNPQICL